MILQLSLVHLALGGERPTSWHRNTKTFTSSKVSAV